jgi:hypothetical protein
MLPVAFAWPGGGARKKGPRALPQQHRVERAVIAMRGLILRAAVTAGVVAALLVPAGGVAMAAGPLARPQPPQGLAFSPAPYDFGQVTMGQRATETFTLTKTGPGRMPPVMITVPGSAAFTITANTCLAPPSRPAQPSPPQSKCMVTVQFAPVGTGTVTARLTATTNGHGRGLGRGTVTDSLTGTGANTVSVLSPGDQASGVGGTVSLQVEAGDSASGQSLTYSATGLPPGLSIGPATGLISGSPAGAGTFSVTVTATDTTGAHGSATFTWTVSAAPNTVSVISPGDQASVVGGTVSLQVEAGDSTSGQSLAYSATGLPPGLSIGPATGLISGSPAGAGTFSVTVTATDTTGAHGSATFTWTVSATSANCQWSGHWSGYWTWNPTTATWTWTWVWVWGWVCS